jgi:DNA modification methylase
MNIDYFVSPKDFKPDLPTAKTYNGIYSMHKYWAKKPYNIIRDFILNYTNKDEIVLDPFCGSGISVTEAIFTGRKAIGIDINPIAIFITEMMLKKIQIKKLKEEYNKLELECKDKIDNLYLVKRRGEQFIGTHFLWKDDQLTEIWYNRSNKKVIDTPTYDDINLANSFSYDKIPYFYPERKFFNNSRINADGNKHIYELFTPRNLYALSLLYDRIEKISDEDIRNALKFVFTASLGQASKLVFIIKRRGKFSNKRREIERKEVGSWVIGYWIPKEHFEINVWKCFENRYRKILSAKEKQMRTEYLFEPSTNFDDLAKTNKNLMLVLGSTNNELKNFPDNSIDYIITDPPHGDRIPYLELSMMWNEWLRKEVNYDDEIVISDSRDRNKDITNYLELFNNVLKNVERVLKPDHYFTLIFNSLDDYAWINLVKSLNDLNFVLYKIEFLRYSSNSVVQDTRDGGLKTDFVLTFKKDQNKIKKEVELLTGDKFQNIIMNKIRDFIGKSEKGLETYEILNFLISEFYKDNRIFKLSEVLNILKNNFTKVGNKWK